MILDKINLPEDLKSLSIAELSQLSAELRDFIQSTTKAKAGHVKASLAVSELTVALHYVFNAPEDILIWDVGHQAYIHKVLTGRKSQFHTNRLKGGISGFTKTSESEYDPFGAGHSSTSISAAVGFAMGSRLAKSQRKQIAVIGDGAITGGMSFEALNYLGEQKLDVLIILNDNESSIDENVGALAAYGNYGAYCTGLGIEYLGEVEGHNMAALVENLQSAKEKTAPRLLRVKTRKVNAPSVAIPIKSDNATTFQEVFADAMIEMATANNKLVAITPAMLSGSGLDGIKEKFPDRAFDVGIAEQHAVTMAAGLAADGFIPVVHLYSTFSQRAYDQIIHDVVLQGLHVIFCLGRAGLVGADGATHHGAFDPGFLNTIPGLTIAAPMDGVALQTVLNSAVKGTGAWVIRYPKSTCRFLRNTLKVKPSKIRQLKEGKQKAVLSFGAIGATVMDALSNSDFAHYDVTYLKPLDQDSLFAIANKFKEVITVEENSARGGLGDAVRAFYAEKGIDIKVKSLALPDRFIEHGTMEELHQLCGLDKKSILRFIEH